MAMARKIRNVTIPKTRAKMFMRDSTLSTSRGSISLHSRSKKAMPSPKDCHQQTIQIDEPVSLRFCDEITTSIKPSTVSMISVSVIVVATAMRCHSSTRKWYTYTAWATISPK